MKEYKFLNVARNIFKVLAWIVLALGVIVGLIVLITGASTPTTVVPGAAPPTARAAGLVFIIMGGFYFLILYSISEIIGILLDIKASSSKTV